jgi:hypothetical protein
LAPCHALANFSERKIFYQDESITLKTKALEKYMAFAARPANLSTWTEETSQPATTDKSTAHLLYFRIHYVVLFARKRAFSNWSI